MGNYQGLLTDFDGTIHKGNLQVSPVVTKALKALHKQDIPHGICTGRHFTFIRNYVQTNRFHGAHIVCGGACLVDDGGTILQQKTIPAGVIDEIIHLIEDDGGLLLLKTHIQEYGNDFALENRHTPFPLLPLSELDDHAVPAFYISHLKESTWQKLESRQDIGLCKQRSRFGKKGYFGDGVAPGISKKSGVLRWCNHHGLDPETVIAIGDGENDVYLFEAVGMGLAMGNAVPELKAVADAVLPDIESDGVACAIEQYFGITG